MRTNTALTPVTVGQPRKVAKDAAQYVPSVIFTIVDKDKTQEEIENCKKIAADRGVTLRIRSFIDS